MTALVEKSQTQRERLAFLEMRAYFTGELRRSDIEIRFGVKPAAASRDLAAYRETAPKNLEYDPVNRCYRPSASFVAQFQFSADRVLSWMTQGFGDGLDTDSKKAFPCQGPVSIADPDLDVLAVVTRALCARRILKTTYLSISSGRSTRLIAPVALANTGQRWHLRAFDRKNVRFSDFALRRIIKAEMLDEQASEFERIEKDEQWTRMVDLNIVPHPKAAWPEGIVADHAMVKGVLRTRVRAALAGYFLRRWNVDCTSNGALDGSEHQLWLRNRDALRGVESAALAPGHKGSETKNIDK